MCLVQVASFAITMVGALWWALGYAGDCAAAKLALTSPPTIFPDQP